MNKSAFEYFEYSICKIRLERCGALQSLNIVDINNGIPHFFFLSIWSPTSVALFAVWFSFRLSDFWCRMHLCHCFVVVSLCQTCKFTVRSLFTRHFFCIKDFFSFLNKQMHWIMVQCRAAPFSGWHSAVVNM